MYQVIEGFPVQGTLLLFIIFSFFYLLVFTYITTSTEEKYHAYATGSNNGVVQNSDEDEVILDPIIKNNPNLRVEEVLDGLDFPTSMAFLGPDDILVLEKNEGMVKRVLNGVLLEEPLLNTNVANEGERGMLGIAIAEKDTSVRENDNDNSNHITYVFLYYTESIDQDDGDDIPDNIVCHLMKRI